MASWFRINLGDPMLAGEPQDQIAALVEATCRAASDSNEIAAFIRHESGGLHCEAIVYLTPAAADIANRFNAVPCALPSSEGLSLLAGSGAALHQLLS